MFSILEKIFQQYIVGLLCFGKYLKYDFTLSSGKLRYYNGKSNIYYNGKSKI